MDTKLANIDEKTLQIISEAEETIKQQLGEHVALIAYEVESNVKN